MVTVEKSRAVEAVHTNEYVADDGIPPHYVEDGEVTMKTILAVLVSKGP